MTGDKNERFGAGSREPTLGVVRGAEVGIFTVSVGLENLIWHLPNLTFPGVESQSDGHVTSVDGVEVEPFTGNYTAESLD